MIPRLIVSGALVCATTLALQQPPRFASNVDTVVVYATVRGEDGVLVRNLTRDDFTVTDNGDRRDIVTFSADVQPITLSFMLDRSPSTTEARSDVTNAALAFVDRLIDGDRASVATLQWDCQPLVGDRNVLAGMVRASARVNDVGSPIWPALGRTMTSLESEGGRRAILLFSDGADTGSAALGVPDFYLGRPPGVCQPLTTQLRASAGDVARRAARDGILVYAVGIAGRTHDDMRKQLVDLAQDTGGEFVQLSNTRRLRDAFTRIADELHHQYALGFRPAVLDGKEHRIEVAVAVKSTRPGITVRARTRYVAASNAPAEPAATPRPAPVAPPAPLTDDEVRRAIEAGTAARPAPVTCMAGGVFKNRPSEESQVSARVTLEGPIDHVARYASDAAARGETFSAARVTDDMRAPVVHLVAELVAPGSGARGTTPPSAVALTTPFITVVRIWSDDRMVQALNPLSSQGQIFAATRTVYRGSERVSSTYDLAAFRALPAGNVDIVAYSLVGERTCSLSPSDRARVK